MKRALLALAALVAIGCSTGSNPVTNLNTNSSTDNEDSAGVQFAVKLDTLLYGTWISSTDTLSFGADGKYTSRVLGSGTWHTYYSLLFLANTETEASYSYVFNTKDAINLVDLNTARAKIYVRQL